MGMFYDEVVQTTINNRNNSLILNEIKKRIAGAAKEGKFNVAVNKLPYNEEAIR